MPDRKEADIVFVGAGHNALVCAAYLSLAGLKVLMIDARTILGGATATEELTLPGFKHDTFSTGHPGIQRHPILSDPRIGLGTRYGLTYLKHDPVFVMPFPDGTSITLSMDHAVTAASLARLCPDDGKAWYDLVRTWERLEPYAFQTASRMPGAPLDVPPAVIAEWNAITACSVLDVVCERFRHPHSRLFLLWLATLTGQLADTPGTGILAFSLPNLWARHSWAHPKGGAIELPLSLARFVVDQGGEIVLGKTAAQIIVENGRAVGVRTTNGDEYRARQAVVSNIHIKNLPDAVGQENLPADFLRSADAFQEGTSVFVVHLALKNNPRVRTGDGPVASVLTGSATLEGFWRNMTDLRAGRHSPHEGRFFFAGCSTIVDPSRAPVGRGIAKLIVIAPYAINGSPDNWAAVKEGYAQGMLADYARCVDGYEPGDELGKLVVTPPELERFNPHLYRGATQGGEMIPAQLGLNRPFAGWAHYRMPVAGLYQTGTTTHPGAPVTGWPGRHAARAVLEDLGMDASEILGGT
jgi:phytoene dehydrogenase-like protein